MRLKSKLMSFVVAGTLMGIASSGANAATLVFAGGSNYTSGTFGRSNIAAGDFTDTLSFNVGWWHQLVASLTSKATKLATANKGDIDFKKVLLTWNDKAVYQFDITNNGGKNGLTDTAEIEHILRPGKYVLAITGYSYGRGSYSGQTFAEAVPEPASWAMMIGGLGIAGGALRRRQTRTTLRYA